MLLARNDGTMRYSSTAALLRPACYDMYKWGARWHDVYYFFPTSILQLRGCPVGSTLGPLRCHSGSLPEFRVLKQFVEVPVLCVLWVMVDPLGSKPPKPSTNDVAHNLRACNRAPHEDLCSKSCCETACATNISQV